MHCHAVAGQGRHHCPARPGVVPLQNLRGTAPEFQRHGPTGQGNPAANYPVIAGQYAVYAAKQLRDYASGARKSAPVAVVNAISVEPAKA